MKSLNHLLKTFFLFLLVVLLITACSKTGPQGAQGPQGVAGPAGTVAKVIYSPWLTPEAFGYSSDAGGPYFLYLKDDTAITPAIINSGAVLIYGQLSGYDGNNNLPFWGTKVALLPISVPYKINGVAQIDTWSASANVGELRIELRNNNNLYTSTDSISTANIFRYIIMSGGIPEGRMAGPPPDHKDYNAVCKYYGIPPR